MKVALRAFPHWFALHGESYIIGLGQICSATPFLLGVYLKYHNGTKLLQNTLHNDQYFATCPLNINLLIQRNSRDGKFCFVDFVSWSNNGPLCATQIVAGEHRCERFLAIRYGKIFYCSPITESRGVVPSYLCIFGVQFECVNKFRNSRKFGHHKSIFAAIRSNVNTVPTLCNIAVHEFPDIGLGFFHRGAIKP